jgi:two-component sensor histidine kinase
MLNIGFDAFLAFSLGVVSITYLIAFTRQQRIHRHLRVAFLLYACGMLAVAAALISPHIQPDASRYEPLMKALAALTLIGACVLSWPLVRDAARRTKVLASMPDPKLLMMERDDMIAANSELEKEMVRRSYQLERVNRQMRLALIGSPITVFRQDREGRYTWIFNPPDHFEPDIIGKTDTAIFPPDFGFEVAEIKERAMRTQEEQSAEVHMRVPSGQYWYLQRTQPDYDENGEVIGTISCAIDITEQKRQQQRQQLLMREVTHRAKNLLAVIQGIVRQTALRSRDFDSFITSFTARLQAIARSHDLLVQDDWSGTSLTKLIESQLSILSEIDPARVKIRGQDALLTAVAVQNLGLAFHELATNAVKYGSLSRARGKVQIEWSVNASEARSDAENAAGQQLRLVWREIGGPSVRAGDDSGFGRTLLERVVGRALGGTASLDFAPDGLVCTMMLPVDRVIADAEAPLPASDTTVH